MGTSGDRVEQWSGWTGPAHEARAGTVSWVCERGGGRGEAAHAHREVTAVTRSACAGSRAPRTLSAPRARSFPRGRPTATCRTRRGCRAQPKPLHQVNGHVDDTIRQYGLLEKPTTAAAAAARCALHATSSSWRILYIVGLSRYEHRRKSMKNPITDIRHQRSSSRELNCQAKSNQCFDIYICDFFPKRVCAD